MPTAIGLTLRELRRRGAIADVVERWMPGARRRRDLFGFADIIAIVDGRIVAVQAYRSGVREHVERITSDPSCRRAALAWLRAGGQIQLWWWRQLRRGARVVWRPRIHRILIRGDGLCYRIIDDD